MSNELQIQFSLKARPGEVTKAPVEGRFANVTRCMALAIDFENQVRSGQAKDYADVARLRNLSRERVSQIVRLNGLAPDIQIEILYLPPTATGQYPISEAAIRRIANILAWPEQRKQWLALKGSLRLV